MIRTMKFLMLALLAAGFASCSDDKDTQPEFSIDLEIDASELQLFLDKEAGSENSFTVTSNVAWSIEYDNAEFTVSPTSPTGYQTEVKVSAKSTNPETHFRKLGNILIRCSAAGRDLPISVYQKSKVANRTVLLYMPGTNLRGFYARNIDLCRKAVSENKLGDGRLLICHQPSGHDNAIITELYYDEQKQDCEAIKLLAYDDFEAGNKAKVARLFADMAILAPAEHYGLVIGSHGKAWIPSGTRLTMRPLAETGGVSEEAFWQPVAGAKPTRSFGDTNHSLEIPELSEILSKLPFRFDYLMFDACFMSNVETLYDLRKEVDYIVASPCEIMASGFPYDTIVPHLFSGLSEEEYLPKVCEAYWHFYTYDWQNDPMNESSGCIAMTRTKELDALAEKMLEVNTSEKKQFNLSQIQTYEGLDNHVFFDLGHYVELSCADEGAKASFMAQMERTFPKAAALHTETFYSVYNGMPNPIHYYTGVTFSGLNDRYKVENQKTAWYQATH